MANFKSLLMITSLIALTLSGCESTPKQHRETIVTTPNKLELNGRRYAHAMVNDGEKLYVIGGASGNRLLSSIEIIDPKTNKSTKLTQKVIARRYFSAVWDGKESIYILGGISTHGDKYQHEKTVEVFNTRTHQVTQVKKLPAPTRTNTAVYKDGKIFVFGGSFPRAGTTKYQRLVSVYDIASNKWMRGQDMPIAKASEAFVKGDYVYLVGGYNGKQSLNTFERYNTKLNRWQTLPNMPYRISAHSLALSGDKLYVFGNYLDTTATYSFDFKTKQWAKANLDYVPARHTAATMMDGTIYVSGGTADVRGPNLDNIQVFKL
ncbi:hypothetical protein MHM98_17860 [Psychrobium sp. MM17-31]|uniref:Kelch repeat-containing protein n=1 Tax=Psychrobium sp. MM17-31 TaxID=2917758 RepID=UPI001EF54EC8|nr:kelch repeat-containing protein [Psychrobium sp. MM17-31]MCG7533198.1 hypothetical protein [Psychrobium sp. MM17-31]